MSGMNYLLDVWQTPKALNNEATDDVSIDDEAIFALIQPSLPLSLGYHHSGYGRLSLIF